MKITHALVVKLVDTKHLKADLELQYKHSDFIDFNKRNNISC